MGKTWSELPFILCPHCNNSFQYDDYYDLSRGDIVNCQECEKGIHIVLLDTSIHVNTSTEPED